MNVFNMDNFILQVLNYNIMLIFSKIWFNARNCCNATCYSLETLHWFSVNLWNIEVLSSLGHTCPFKTFFFLDIQWNISKRMLLLNMKDCLMWFLSIEFSYKFDLNATNF